MICGEILQEGYILAAKVIVKVDRSLESCHHA